jgi:hypothetical protein
MVSRESTKRHRAATLNRQSMYQLSSTAYRHAAEVEGASIRDAADWMDVSPTTALRVMQKGERILALKSRRLRRHFLACLQRLVKEDDRRTARALRAGAHEGTIGREGGTRKLRRRSGSKRDDAKGAR